MNLLNKLDAEAKAEMADVYKGIELNSGSKYAFEAGYFKGRLSVALEENERLKKVIDEYKKKGDPMLSTTKSTQFSNN